MQSQIIRKKPLTEENLATLDDLKKIKRKIGEMYDSTNGYVQYVLQYLKFLYSIVSKLFSCRNMSLLLTCANSPLRNAPFENIKVADVVNADLYKEFAIVHIHGEHKTKKQHGDAKPCIPTDIFRALQEFLKVHREQFQSVEENEWLNLPLFAQTDGRKLNGLSVILAKQSELVTGKPYTVNDYRFDPIIFTVSIMSRIF